MMIENTNITFQEACKLFCVCNCILEQWIENGILQEAPPFKNERSITQKSIKEKIDDEVFMGALKIFQTGGTDYSIVLEPGADEDKVLKEKIAELEYSVQSNAKRISALEKSKRSLP